MVVLARRPLLAALLAAQAPTAIDRPRLLIPIPQLSASAAAAASAAAVVSPAAAASAAAASATAADKLLDLIPAMPFGAPATNATIPAPLVVEIEGATAALELAAAQRDNVREANLNGSWRLLYSNGREITSLAAGLPLGFVLGPTFQPLDTATARFENQGNVLSRYGIARLSTTVVGDVRPAPAASLNTAGVRNDRGNRVDVEFRRITFSLDELFGSPVRLAKVLTPNLKEGVEQPANDQTYLSANVRVVRGGDGALFIFRREESDRPLLSMAEREALYRDKGVDVTTGSGRAEDSAPPELKRLLREP